MIQLQYQIVMDLRVNRPAIYLKKIQWTFRQYPWPGHRTYKHTVHERPGFRTVRRRSRHVEYSSLVANFRPVRHNIVFIDRPTNDIARRRNTNRFANVRWWLYSTIARLNTAKSTVSVGTPNNVCGVTTNCYHGNDFRSDFHTYRQRWQPCRKKRRRKKKNHNLTQHFGGC